MKKNAEEERKRNWALGSLAKFGELLRNQDQNLQKFGDRGLSFTIKYLNANQGRLLTRVDYTSNTQLLHNTSVYLR